MSGSELSLRAMEWTDIPALVGLDAELFGHHAWSAPTWWSELAGRPRRRYVVAVDGDRIAGYCGLDSQGDVVDVMTIGVAKADQGRGLGRVLLDDALAFAGESRSAAMLLEVRADNDAALALYGRVGFEQISVRRRYYQPEGVDALVLRKKLGDGDG